MFSVNYYFCYFFVKQDKRVKSRFWLFNLCNSEKKMRNRPTWVRTILKKRVRYSVFIFMFNFVRLRPRIKISVHP